MTAEAAHLGRHKHLGDYCKCGALADVVATYQHGQSIGYPFGRVVHVPLCNPCGLAALRSGRPPRITEHDSAVLRRDKQTKATRARRRKDNADAQLRIEGV